MEVILEGTRRVDEWEILKKNIPEPNMVFKINRSVEEKRDTINLTANEWRIISLVDGRRTVQQVVEDSGNDEFSVYRVINSLISSGLVEPSAGIATVPSEDKSEAPAIIHMYHLVLMSILKITQKSVGARAHNLLEEAKAQVPSQYAKLLRSFDYRGDAKKNVKSIVRSAANTPPSNKELVNAFNAWILAILHKQHELLDGVAIVAGIKEVTKQDAAWQKFPGKSNIKGVILSAIIQTVEQFQREVEKDGKDKAKASGILSFLKRK
jgi:sugar-specific transcriptional regulator TrmB